MSAETILTLANGKGIDSLDPKASDYSGIDAVAEQPAKEKRYNSATPGPPYGPSCAIAAPAILLAYGWHR